MAEATPAGSPPPPEDKLPDANAAGTDAPGAEADDFLTAASFEDPQAASEQAAADAELEKMIASVAAEAGAVTTGVGGGGGGSSPAAPKFDFPSLGGGFDGGGGAAVLSPIDLLRDVELNVKIELGRSKMLVEDVLKLGEGSVVELDKLAGDPVDVFVNDRLVARGEVLVLNDNFCVRVNEIVAAAKDELA